MVRRKLRWSNLLNLVTLTWPCPLTFQHLKINRAHPYTRSLHMWGFMFNYVVMEIGLKAIFSYELPYDLDLWPFNPKINITVSSTFLDERQRKGKVLVVWKLRWFSVPNSVTHVEKEITLSIWRMHARLPSKDVSLDQVYEIWVKHLYHMHKTPSDVCHFTYNFVCNRQTDG